MQQLTIAGQARSFQACQDNAMVLKRSWIENLHKFEFVNSGDSEVLTFFRFYLQCKLKCSRWNLICLKIWFLMGTKIFSPCIWANSDAKTVSFPNPIAPFPSNSPSLSCMARRAVVVPKWLLWHRENARQLVSAPWVSQFCGSSWYAKESRSLMWGHKPNTMLWFWENWAPPVLPSFHAPFPHHTALHLPSPTPQHSSLLPSDLEWTRNPSVGIGYAPACAGLSQCWVVNESCSTFLLV